MFRPSADWARLARSDDGRGHDQGAVDDRWSHPNGPCASAVLAMPSDTSALAEHETGGCVFRPPPGAKLRSHSVTRPARPSAERARGAGAIPLARGLRRAEFLVYACATRTVPIGLKESEARYKGTVLTPVTTSNVGRVPACVRPANAVNGSAPPRARSPGRSPHQRQPL